MGEAARRVPQDWRERYPDLPWREMVGTRNRLAHTYFATELFILHEIATKLLPALLPRLSEIVGEARRPPRLRPSGACWSAGVLPRRAALRGGWW